MTSWPFDRCGSRSRVSRPLRRRREVEVSSDQEGLDVESRTCAYSFSSGFAGHASRRRPPAQIRSAPGLPMIDPLSSRPA